MEFAKQLIINAGLRPTKARIAVLSTISHANKALSHAEILARLADDQEMDRVTVYRVLDWLLDNTLVHKISTEDRAWKFQLNKPKAQFIESSQSSIIHQNHAHAHLHCEQCGSVTCIHEFSANIPAQTLKKYKVSHIEVTLKGVCTQCSQITP